MSNKGFIIINVIAISLICLFMFIFIDATKRLFTKENAKQLIIDFKRVGNYIDTVSIKENNQ